MTNLWCETKCPKCGAKTQFTKWSMGGQGRKCSGCGVLLLFPSSLFYEGLTLKEAQKNNIRLITGYRALHSTLKYEYGDTWEFKHVTREGVWKFCKKGTCDICKNMQEVK